MKNNLKHSGDFFLIIEEMLFEENLENIEKYKNHP